MLTPTTSITAGSSGKVYISTSENKVKNIYRDISLNQYDF